MQIIASSSKVICLLIHSWLGILLWRLAISGFLLRSITVRYQSSWTPLCFFPIENLYSIMLPSIVKQISFFMVTRIDDYCVFLTSYIFHCRMAMLDLCYHAMMLSLAMILTMTPSRPGNLIGHDSWWLYVCSHQSLKEEILKINSTHFHYIIVLSCIHICSVYT